MLRLRETGSLGNDFVHSITTHCKMITNLEISWGNHTINDEGVNVIASTYAPQLVRLDLSYISLIHDDKFAQVLVLARIKGSYNFISC
jgi:hypothetical protein